MQPQFDDIQLQGREELERLDAALKIYLKTGAIEPVFDPPIWTKPEYREPTFKDTFGLKSTLMWLSVFGSMAVSAFTVGLILFISALNTEKLLVNMTNVPGWLNVLINTAPVIFFAAGTFAFEGYAVSHALAKGEEMEEVTYSPVALIAAFSVMVATGILRSLGLGSSGPEDTFYKLVLGAVVLATGLGAPLIVFYGTLNIGVMRKQFRQLLKTAKMDFEAERQNEHDRWQKLYDDAYSNFLERQVAFQKQFKKWYQDNAEMIFGVERKIVTNRKLKQKEDRYHSNIQKMVEEYLQEKGISPFEVGAEQGMLMTPMALAENLGIMDANGKPDSGPIRPVLYRLRARVEAANQAAAES